MKAGELLPVIASRFIMRASYGKGEDNMDRSIVQRLFGLQDMSYQAFQCKLMPTVSPNVVIWVRMPDLRRLAKQLQNTPEGEKFLSHLPHTYYEENNLHGLLLCQCTDYQTTIVQLSQFLPHVDNWATCDLLVPKAFQNHPDPLPEQVFQWLQAEHPYTVRFGLGVLLRFYLDEWFHPHYLAWASQIHREDYYVKMMVAWYFAEALIKQPDTALPYLLERRLSPWVHNKTIQKAVESYRIDSEQKEFLRTLRRK